MIKDDKQRHVTKYEKLFEITLYFCLFNCINDVMINLIC